MIWGSDTYSEVIINGVRILGDCTREVQTADVRRPFPDLLDHGISDEPKQTLEALSVSSIMRNSSLTVQFPSPPYIRDPQERP